MIYLSGRSFREALYDLYDLYGLAHAAGWEPHDLHDLAQALRVGCVVYVYRPCGTSHDGSYMIYLVCDLCYLYRDKCVLDLNHDVSVLFYLDGDICPY